MTFKKKLLIALLVLAAGAAFLIIKGVRESVPATPGEIRTAITATTPECHDLTVARVREAIARSGALSRRQLATITRLECPIAAAQYEATLGAQEDTTYTTVPPE